MINLGTLPRGKYMTAIIDLVGSRGRKTPVYAIHEGSGTNRLGEIKWYGPWRGFCFFPKGNTVFDAECLQQIREWIAELNKRYKEHTRARVCD